MKVLCTICARKGSKGLKNKNFLKINNKLLIEYTIEVAIKSKIFDEISVSSDNIFSKKFIKKYKDLNFYNRSKKLSKDNVGKVEVIKDLYFYTKKLKNKEFDYIIDLDVTSPLRTKEDVIKAFNKIIKSKKLNLITIVEAKKNPYFNMIEIKNNKLKISKQNKKNILRRQDAPVVYEMNASIYIWSRKTLLSKRSLVTNSTDYYLMDRYKSIDIDDDFDFKIVKSIIEKKL